MKTIDTSKLWTLVKNTSFTWPEIIGPGGLCMDMHGATDEQAQEVADILNGATQTSPFTITHRQGEMHVVYSAPAADEVVWMARQGEQVDCVQGGAGLDLASGEATLGTSDFTGAWLDEALEVKDGAEPAPAPEASLSKALRILADAAEGQIWESVTRAMRDGAARIDQLESANGR